MLRDILGCVEADPSAGPWYAARYSPTIFGIFEVFPNVAGRNAHVAGRAGDIFRDVERMNAILAQPAHVFKVDVLLSRRSLRVRILADLTPDAKVAHLRGLAISAAASNCPVLEPNSAG